ncbi:MAG: hypothetical protein KBS60_03705 [Phascolarctobacterium sp.]|nr:hypothetical protein [Candidatus Phascolarctobacterium caballi]
MNSLLLWVIVVLVIVLIVFFCRKKFISDNENGIMVAYSWDEVIDTCIDSAKEIASHWDLDIQDIIGGAWEAVLQKSSEDMATVIQKFYFQGNDGKFYCETVCVQISIDKVPEELVNELNIQVPVDITERMREKIKSKLELDNNMKGSDLDVQKNNN